MTRPLLHFAHANGFPAACYRPLLDLMTPQADVLVIDKMAHDPRFPVTPGWTALADEVAESVRQQAGGRPVIGVGHSLGGMCTWMAAHRHPGLFSGLILLDPPAVNGLPGLMMGLARVTGQIDRVTPAGLSSKRRDRWPDRESAAASLRPKGLFKAFDPACFEAYVQHALVDDEEGVRLAFDVAQEVAIFRNGPWHMRPYRRQLGLPGAVVTGASSEFRGMGTHQRLARRQHLRWLTAPGGHMFPLEHPQDTAALLLALVRDIKSAQGPLA